MKFSNIGYDETTKDVNFDVSCNKDEIAWLVNYAVNSLLAEGFISINKELTEQEIPLGTVAQ